MDCEQCKEDKVKCNRHPDKSIAFIYCKQNCPYPSRLACRKCVKEYRSWDGFEELLEVLKNPRVILNSQNDHEFGIYNLLNTYFEFQEQDPDQFIQFFKKGIQRQIEKLEQDLKEGIEKFNKFRAQIANVQKQFNDALGHENLKKAFKDILKIEGYHYGPEWNDLEMTVQNFILQFKDQNNQELQEAYQKVRQMHENFFKPQILSDFQGKTFKSVEALCYQLNKLGIFHFTQMCDQFYCLELIQRMQKNKELMPKVTLLFRASEHGMNAQAFWAKCSNQGPTITICKSKNGYVFGGYTPCKWVPGNASWQKDESKTSFLFSYTRKEIYPILSVDHAIYCHQTGNYGPTFGGSHNLYIAADFQSGHSRMTGQFYSNESYKIENQNTHLMVSETPQLVEMEVFAIE